MPLPVLTDRLRDFFFRDLSARAGLFGGCTQFTHEPLDFHFLQKTMRRRQMCIRETVNLRVQQRAEFLWVGGGERAHAAKAATPPFRAQAARGKAFCCPRCQAPARHGACPPKLEHRPDSEFPALYPCAPRLLKPSLHMGALYYGDNLDIFMRYLAMLAPRLVELCRALKPTCSLYLHCDDAAL